MMNFYYSRGDISTNIPWVQPSIDTFHKWLNKWSRTPHVNDYSVYLTGGFCQNYFYNRTLDTWDIDVILKADPKVDINYSNLKNILGQGIKIGFENRLLIDIYLVGEIPTEEKFSWKKVLYGRTIVKQTPFESWQEDLNGRITELIPGLYQSIKNPIKQYNKYISKGYDVPCQQVIL